MIIELILDGCAVAGYLGCGTRVLSILVDAQDKKYRMLVTGEAGWSDQIYYELRLTIHNGHKSSSKNVLTCVVKRDRGQI
jgi:hypothetical protein